MRAALGEGARIAVSGADPQRAEAAARRLLDEGATRLISVGVAGGLDPALRPGAVLIPDQVLCATGVYTPDADWCARAKAAASEAVTAAVWGSDDLVSTADAKAALFAQHEACAVDMETHRVARAAVDRGALFGVVRTIADPAERALPQAASDVIGADGAPRLGRVLKNLMKRPGDLPGLIKVGQDSATAHKALGRALTDLQRAGLFG